METNTWEILLSGESRISFRDAYKFVKIRVSLEYE